jgi:hypothetical protein
MSTRLIQIALAATLSVAAAGQLPGLLETVQLVEHRLLKDSESTKRGLPFLLPIQEHAPKHVMKSGARRHHKEHS